MNDVGRHGAFRREHDSLGEVAVPADAYYGAQTARAVANFPISGVPISHHPIADPRARDGEAGGGPRELASSASSRARSARRSPRPRRR